MRQAILDLWRHLGMHNPANNPILLHLSKLLYQHLLRDRRDRPLQIGESLQLAAEQMEQDHQFPPAFENPECSFDAVGRRSGRYFIYLTFWWVPYLSVCTC